MLAVATDFAIEIKRGEPIFCSARVLAYWGSLARLSFAYSHLTESAFEDAKAESEMSTASMFSLATWLD